MSEHPNNLTQRLKILDPQSALRELEDLPADDVAHALADLPPAQANVLLAAMDVETRTPVMAAAPDGTGWADAQSYAEGSVGRLLEPPPAVFARGTPVAEAIERLRTLIKQRMVVYLFVVDEARLLLGVVAFRELLYAPPGSRLDDIMLRDPFVLRPQTPLVDAMREVVTRHFPVYPVCEIGGRLVGQVRGQALFEQQAFEISAQAGAMFGVEKEERLATPLLRSFSFRHPWLLLNLLTAFLSAAVVGFFESTVEQIVVLAMFLPVLAGQCGNLGAQALAVMVRAMTLGETRGAGLAKAVVKEAALGFMNGAITGALAGAAMYWAVLRGDGSNAMSLALITTAAMTVSATIAGLSGAMIPLALKRLGADPATASSIFLTTITDVVSMGLLLGLASVLLL